MNQPVAIQFSVIEPNSSCKVSGDMTFATAVSALQLAEPLIQDAQSLRFDLSGVTQADSAGVALLIEWQHVAKSAACRLCYSNLPESLVAMIRVAGVQGMLPVIVNEFTPAHFQFKPN